MTMNNWRGKILLPVSLLAITKAIGQPNLEIRRDPFRPVAVSPCENNAHHLLKGWVLLGVVGVKGAYRGWVSGRDGQWLRLATDEYVQAGWRVERIDLKQLDLYYENPDESCVEAPRSLSWSLQKS